jgi:hypothetical protein
VTALVLLDSLVPTLGSGVIGWLTAARRHQAAETSLRREIESAGTKAEQARTRHEAIVQEMANTVLQVMRAQGGESL